MVFLTLLLGFALLIKGADLLVDSASKLAKTLGISEYIIGLSVVAFGTSAPELVIGLLSAIQKNNQITLGNVIGSCIINIALILGLTTIILPIRVPDTVRKKELPLLIIVESTFLFLSYSGADVSRFDGGILLLGFMLLMYYLTVNAKKSGSFSERADGKQQEKTSIFKQTVVLLVGLAGLTAGGNLVVTSSRSIALQFGLSQTLIGLTIVSIGTTLPELITSVVAALKKQTDIAVANILGSNLFNILFIMGVSSVINPVPVTASTRPDLAIMLSVTVLFWFIVSYKSVLSRKTGFLLVTCYLLYLLSKLIL